MDTEQAALGPPWIPQGSNAREAPARLPARARSRRAVAGPEAASPADAKTAATPKSPVRLQLTSRESEQGAPPHLEGPSHTTCGSDFMVDVMRNLGIDYVAAIPATRSRACMSPSSTTG